MLVVNIIIGLYGTPADRQAVLRLAWYIRLIRFEDLIRTRKKNDSQVPNPSTYTISGPCNYSGDEVQGGMQFPPWFWKAFHLSDPPHPPVPLAGPGDGQVREEKLKEEVRRGKARERGE